jgi:hypothetical protein
MAPPDAQASASCGFSAFLSHWSRWLPGSDRLGTIDLPCRRTAAVSYSVEPLSPMAPPDARASASYGCSAVLSYWLRWHPGSDRLRTIDLPCRRASGGIIQCRAIVPNGSARRASGGFLRLFGFFVLLVAVASRFRSIGDNRSTMPTRSGGVLQCRAIVPNGSARRASGGFLRLFGFFVLLVAVASWFRSIADNRSTMPPRKRRRHTE